MTWYIDNDGRKLSLKYFCLMCYRFRIISGIRSNNEFSSRETKTPAIDEFQINEINVDLRTSGFDNEVLSVDACAVW